MRRAVFLAVLIVSACSELPHVESPPQPFRGDASYAIKTVSDTAHICGVNKALACEFLRTVYMPNPCDAKWKDDAYAALLCHEQGHINGWIHPTSSPE